MNLWLPASTAFLASLLEAVEALTVVLAVGVTHGWRVALGGAAWAVAVLSAIVLVLGPAIVFTVPIGGLRLVVGIFLLLFGLSWSRKAILRYGGRRALRDERTVFARDVDRMGRDRVDARTAFATAFQTVLLEGLEVAIIVVTVGASSARGGLGAAALGALAAVLLVAGAGFTFRAPLARIPENALGFAVGIMLTSFGTYWSGEGLGLTWWHDDLVLGVLALFYLVVAAALVGALRAAQRLSAARP